MNYVLKRVISYLIVLIIVANIDFFLPREAGGNPAILLARGARVPAEAVKAITLRLGLNQPLASQYVKFLLDTFATFPPYFGVSFLYYPISVSQLFLRLIPWDLLLIVTSVSLAFTMAYLMAVVSSLRRKGKVELSFLYSSIVTQGIPSYWIAMVFLWIFAVQLGWFPLVGSGSGTGASLASSIIMHAVLPIVVLAITIFGQYYLILRGSIQEILKSDYVFAAKCRGLRNTIVGRRYILRNALLPIVSTTSFSLGALIGSAILVETVFSYPGVGSALVDSLFSRDYPVLTGFFFLITALIIIGGLIGDLILVRLDPRLR